MSELPPPCDLRSSSAEERSALSEQLYLHLAPRILLLGTRFYGSRSDEAEELVAETFARVVGALGRFRGGSSYSTWVTRIAMNVIGERLRGKGPRGTLPELPGDDPPASERLRNQERSHLIQQGLEALAPDHRMVLSLIAQEGLPHAEAAALLGVAEGTVWSRYARARLALAAEFRRLGVAE